MGTKVLAVLPGGTLELHGARRDAVSWTHLAASAQPGATSITLAEAVDWRPGDRIVLAPSGFVPEEAEELTVTAVDGATVSFTPALAHVHLGEQQTIEGTTVDTRAEVGLLTRDLVLRGDEGSAAEEYGGHVIVLEGGQARIEGAQFTHMGQKGLLGRYPMHWHITREGAGQYLKSSSIDHSFHRAAVVHSTDGVLVEDNVAYDVFSQTFVVAEAGDEEGNSFICNLGVLTKMLPEGERVSEERKPHSEHRPGTFWIKNPNNVVRDNAAAGGNRAIGFFYDKRGTRRPEGVVVDFAGNTAHSYLSRLGGNDRYPPLTRGFGLFSNLQASTRQEFRDFTAYKNANAGVWIEQNDAVVGARLLDNGIGAQMFGNAALEESLVVGQSANAVGTLDLRRGGVNAMSGQGGRKAPQVRDVTFVDQQPAALVFEDDTEPGASAQGLRFVRTQPLLYSDPEHRTGELSDLDGSVSGSGSPQRIVGTQSPAASSACRAEPGWNALVCPPG